MVRACISLALDSHSFAHCGVAPRPHDSCVEIITKYTTLLTLASNDPCVALLNERRCFVGRI